MNEFKLRALHISDFHARGPREHSGWRRRRVLGEAWKQNLDTISNEGEIHLICFTGDAADWGILEEYESATDFFNTTLKHLNLGPDRLFLVPGNHDINREVEPDVWKDLRGYLGTLNPQDVSRWFSGEAKAPHGAIDWHADAIIKRQVAYHNWLKAMGREALLPANSPHHRLGYRSELKLPSWPFDIHVVGLDSSWLAGDDNDSGKLRLTEDQVMLLATDGGKPLERLRLIILSRSGKVLRDKERERPFVQACASIHNPAKFLPKCLPDALTKWAYTSLSL